MNINKKLVVILVVALAVAGIIFYLASRPQESLAPGGAVTEEQESGAAAGETSGTAQKGIFGTILIDIKGFNFAEDEVVIKAGTKIVWVNRDAAPHTVTSDTGVFDSKTLLKGQSFEYVFNQRGDYKYHCGIHPDMKGRIIVQ